MYSLYIVWYIFLAGMGSGAYAVAAGFALAQYFSKKPQVSEYGDLLAGGFVVGPVLVAIGAVFLLFDLGAPERAFAALFDPTPTILTIGVWHIVLFCPLSVLVMFMRYNSKASVRHSFKMVMYVLTAILAIGLMTYTGLFLGWMRSMPFHYNWLLVAIFIVSSLATGSAVIALYGFFNQHRKAIFYSLNFIPHIDLVILIVEFFVLSAFLYTSYTGGEIARYSLELLFYGEASTAFWAGAVFLGMILPLVCIILCLREPNINLIALGSVFTIAGGFFLRYSIIAAGVNVYDYTMLIN